MIFSLFTINVRLLGEISIKIQEKSCYSSERSGTLRLTIIRKEGTQ